MSKLKKLIDKPESPLEYLKRFKDDMTMVMQKHSDDATEFAWEAFLNFHKAVEERFRKPRQSGKAGKEEHDSKTSKSS